jgi:uncharacterized membrane-anchored protein
MAGLPRIDCRYWLIMLFASACGTNLGDFASQTLGLGFVAAFIPYALIFAAVFVVAQKLQTGGEVLYWIAIVISRAGATDVADLASHQFRLNFPVLAILLLTLLLAILTLGAYRGQTTILATRVAEDRWDDRPNSNVTYWCAMACASVIGTLSGDFLADGLGLGVGASAASTLVFAAMLATALAYSQRVTKPLYWTMVLLIRTCATNLGDFIAGDDGLNIGFFAGAVILFLMMAGIAFTWKQRILVPLQQA